jgi:hypothetical protein
MTIQLIILKMEVGEAQQQKKSTCACACAFTPLEALIQSYHAAHFLFWIFTLHLSVSLSATLIFSLAYLFPSQESYF